MKNRAEIVSMEWQETAFYSWHFITYRMDDETWDDQNDDGETKTTLGFTGTGLNDLTLLFLMAMMTVTLIHATCL
jgi:hypothetical protein